MIEILSGELTYLWEAFGDIDQNEGKGGQFSLGLFHTKGEAMEATKTEGVMGYPGLVKEKQVLKQIMGDGKISYWEVNLLEVEDQETIRKRALSKLSIAEKKALGL